MTFEQSKNTLQDTCRDKIKEWAGGLGQLDITRVDVFLHKYTVQLIDLINEVKEKDSIKDY